MKGFYRRAAIWLSCALLVFFMAACGGESTTPTQSNLKLNFEDAVTQQIIALRSKRNSSGQADTEALRTYLALENAEHRYAAVWVAASLQDSSLIEDLARLLKDEHVQIRQMSAFALGQTRNPRAADLLSAAFQQDTVRLVQAAILEAVGKCGSEEQLRHLATVRPYPLKDTMLLEGLALGLYRYAVRGLIYSEGTEKIMNDFISNARMPQSVRFIAANYLARIGGVDVSSYEDVLLNAVRSEKDPETLMFWVIGLAKTQTMPAYRTLIQTYETNSDYRVKCNILRGLQYFKHDTTKLFVANALQDSTQPHIPLVAADHFYRTGRDADALQYYGWAMAHKDWQVRAHLLAAALRHLAPYRTPQKQFVTLKIMELHKASTNPYEQAALLRAVGEYEWNYKILLRELLPPSDSIKVLPLIQSTCAEALAELRSSENFDRVLGINRQKVADELNASFRLLIERGDVGVQAAIATLLTNKKLRAEFKTAYPEWNFLRQAQKRLQLPRDLETWALLQQTIDMFEGKNIDEGYKPPVYKHSPLVEPDWQIIQNIGTQTRAVIETSRGNIFLQFDSLAPATVSHFIQLAKAGYYDGKTFHRVVTNFVAQAGCERGDGWGGSQLCLPSEINPSRYWQAGCVGMASAGKDTESTQFFITHAPTVHLDGNYTLFARVVEGMNVVHQLRIGDTIRSIKIN